MRRIQDVDAYNKCMLLRVDFNVAAENGKAMEKFKIESCRETLKYLLDKNAKVALISHLGRPNGRYDKEFSFKNIVGSISSILKIPVKFCDDIVGDKVREGLNKLKSGQVLLLENVRFHSGEESNDENFARQLAENFDIFVNDAFSVCHRNQASVTGVAKILPGLAGFRLQKEIENLDKVKNNPEQPAVAIIGGAKIETKLPLINKFKEEYKYILVGGKVANEALDQKIKFSSQVVLPEDFEESQLDIGPRTIKKFTEIISTAKTIVWNGPMGKFEVPPFDKGTRAILSAVVSSGAFSLVGGGESVQVLEQENMIDKISFVSTGGGAMLEYLSGNPLPGIDVLRN